MNQTQKNTPTVGYMDVLKSLVNNKTIEEKYINQHFATFVAIDWVSNNPKGCYNSNILNSARGGKFIPKLAEYKFLKNSLGLKNNTYIEFVKKDKDQQRINDAISTIFQVGSRTAKDYIELMGPNKTISTIIDWFNLRDNRLSDPKLIELKKSLKIYQNKQK